MHLKFSEEIVNKNFMMQLNVNPLLRLSTMYFAVVLNTPMPVTARSFTHDIRFKITVSNNKNYRFVLCSAHERNYTGFPRSFAQ